MCLGIPGKVVSVEQNALGLVQGRVSFGGIVKEVCLAYTPEAKVGDYVVVHVGFSISVVDEQEARLVFDYLTGMNDLADLAIPQPEPRRDAGS